MRSVDRRLRRIGFATAVVLALGVGVAGKVDARPVQSKPARSGEHHFVYTQSNGSAGNEVVGFEWDGTALSRIGSWPTGGNGTGFWLGSQGSIAVEGNRLYVVDGGSNDVAMFAIGKNGSLRLLDRESVYGLKPVSLTVDGDRVVVLTTEQFSPCGGIMKCAPVQGEACVGIARCGTRLEDNLTLLRRRGESLELVDHVRLAGNRGSQVSFVEHPGHRRVVVTEKGSNTISSVTVKGRRFGTPTSITSSGNTPYGFGITKRGIMVVSNAEDEVAGAGTVSSYSLRKKTITPVTASLANGQQAPCWVAIGEGGRTAYVSNPDSNTISLVRIGHGGALTLAAASAGPTASLPTDMVVHHRLLFVTAWQTVEVHAIAADGTISTLGGSAIPDYSQGIAVR